MKENKGITTKGVTQNRAVLDVQNQTEMQGIKMEEISLKINLLLKSQD